MSGLGEAVGYIDNEFDWRKPSMGGKLAKGDKTHFVITAKRELRELLWFEERKPGQLLIVQREPANFGWRSADLLGDAHFSVHAPDYGSVTTITRKMERVMPSKERKLLSTVMHIPESLDGFAVVLQGVARSNLSYNSFDPKMKVNAKSLNLGLHNPDRSTLVYALAVARKPSTLSAFKNQSLRFLSGVTETYEVGVFYGYQYLPSNAFQASTFVMSKPAKYDGELLGEGQLDVRPYSDVELRGIASQVMTCSLETNYIQIRRELREYRRAPRLLPKQWGEIYRCCRGYLNTTVS